MYLSVNEWGPRRSVTPTPPFPVYGRFLQVDPVGYDDQFNLYAYVADDPVNKVDPDGTDGACLYTSSGCGGMSFANVGENIRSAADFVSDFVPILGDAKSFHTAYTDPTGVNILVAAIGVVPGAGDLAGKVIKQLEKGAAALEKQALKHEAKLAKFERNPTVRPGMEGQSKATIQKQQQARVNHLKKEIKAFRKQAEERRKMAQKLKEKL